ncbi:hypothetical protein F0562_036078 [Nyssa sinensis]|uniref:Uncharacterized protein n=1 Tax=Nyssa sinensis TaxID=561372 RepID=A0A5J5ACP8_9ASTE|nr:hypothetical protein F0562_036078 [Nyssa sinensis]
MKVTQLVCAFLTSPLEELDPDRPSLCVRSFPTSPLEELDLERRGSTKRQVQSINSAISSEYLAIYCKCTNEEREKRKRDSDRRYGDRRRRRWIFFVEEPKP